MPTRCCWSGVGQSLPGPSTEPLRRPGGFVLALGPAGPGSAPHGSLCGAAGSPLQAGFAPCLPPRQRKRLRWGNRTEGRPLTHGLFTRRACESYSEKCVTVRHRACAETWGRHGARRGGEGTRELWAEPRGAAAPRPRSRCSSRPVVGPGTEWGRAGGLGQGLPGRCWARRCCSAVPWVPGASPPPPPRGGCGEQRGAGLPALPSLGHSRPCRPAPGRCPGLSTGATGATEAWPRCPAPPRPPAPRTSRPGPPAGLRQPCGQRDRFVRN